MNSVFKKVLLVNTPKVNKKITDGAAREVLAGIPKYLDDFFASGLQTLNPKIDFKYLGYRRVSPKEEFNSLVNSRDSTVRYDLSHSSVYVIELRFEYNGKLIIRPIYLPYCNRGNLLVMSDANYHVTPVLSDTVFSPAENGVFVRLLKAKLNFTSKSRYFIVNGLRVTGAIIHGAILKPNQKQIQDLIGKPIPATALYLLGKFGLKETLKIYGGIKDVIVTNAEDVSMYKDYTVYESCKLKPRGLKAVPYIPHNVKILVSGEYNTEFVNNLIYGIIYTLDILPELENDFLSLVSTDNVASEIAFWRIVLGRVIYKNSFSIDRIVQDLDDHYVTLDGYVDAMIESKLDSAGIKASSIFDILALLLTKYNQWTLASKEYNANIDKRYIDILYYLTYDTIIGFNRIILNLNKRITKTNDISYKEVNKLLTNELSSRRVYSLTKSTEPNLAVTSVDYSGDIMYPKVTSILEDQSRGNGVKRGRKSTLPASAKTLKGGDLGFGSLLFLGKNLPSPRFKMNMFMDYDVGSGKVTHTPEITRALVKLSSLLQGLKPTTTLVEAELNSDYLECKDICKDI